MSTNRMVNPLSLGEKKKPTLKHRPAVWESMLGTVYAMDDRGKVQYFDYDYDAAIVFAGVEPGSDLRLARAKMSYTNIRRGQWVLYMPRRSTR